MIPYEKKGPMKSTFPQVLWFLAGALALVAAVARMVRTPEAWEEWAPGLLLGLGCVVNGYTYWIGPSTPRARPLRWITLASFAGAIVILFYRMSLMSRS